MASNDVNAIRRRKAEERLEILLSENGGTAYPANVAGGQQDVLRNAIQLENVATLFELLFAEVQDNKKRRS